MDQSTASSTASDQVGDCPTRSSRGDWVALLVLLSATFMLILDAFIVNVAIPSLENDLGASPSQTQLVVAMYMLTYAAGLMAGGRLGDRFGHLQMFQIGMAIFVGASVWCGGAQSTEALLGGRAAQGVGAALLGPQVLTLLGAVFPGTRRDWAFRGYGVALGVASGGGQILGGALLELDVLGLGWRSCFLINAPLGLVAILIAPRVLPSTKGTGDQRVDLLGAAVITVSMGAFVLPLVEGRARGWPAWTWWSLIASVLLVVVFLGHARRMERTGRAPLVSTELLGDAVVMRGMCAVICFYCGVASFFLVLSIYLQQGRSLGPFASGLAFSVMVAGFLVTTFVDGPFKKVLGRNSLTVGAVTVAVGHLLMGAATQHIGTDGSTWWLFGPMLITGAGIGLIMSPLVSAILAGIDPSRAGTASGLFSSAQQLGNAVGIALIGFVYFETAGSAPTPARVVDAMGASHLYLFAINVMVAALLYGLREPAVTTSRRRR